MPATIVINYDKFHRFESRWCDNSRLSTWYRRRIKLPAKSFFAILSFTSILRWEVRHINRFHMEHMGRAGEGREEEERRREPNQWHITTIPPNPIGMKCEKLQVRNFYIYISFIERSNTLNNSFQGKINSGKVSRIFCRLCIFTTVEKPAEHWNIESAQQIYDERERHIVSLFIWNDDLYIVSWCLWPGGIGTRTLLCAATTMRRDAAVVWRSGKETSSNGNVAHCEMF